jgi:hypothetical protein
MPRLAIRYSVRAGRSEPAVGPLRGADREYAMRQAESVRRAPAGPAKNGLALAWRGTLDLQP